ncbi:MAG: hypothetical protein ACKOX6_11190 [Bdellovibrio sp.]
MEQRKVAVYLVDEVLLERLTLYGLAETFFIDRNFHATFYCEKMLAFSVKRNGNFIEVLKENQNGELRSAVLILQPASRKLRVVSDWNEVALTSEEFGDQSL